MVATGSQTQLPEGVRRPKTRETEWPITCPNGPYCGSSGSETDWVIDKGHRAGSVTEGLRNAESHSMLLDKSEARIFDSHAYRWVLVCDSRRKIGPNRRVVKTEFWLEVAVLKPKIRLKPTSEFWWQRVWRLHSLGAKSSCRSSPAKQKFSHAQHGMLTKQSCLLHHTTALCPCSHLQATRSAHLLDGSVPS